jgi:hypothetical protein
MTLSDCVVELGYLGFGDVEPETMDGMAVSNMLEMAGAFNDVAEYPGAADIRRVAKFVESMMPLARKISAKLNLQEQMLAKRVLCARAGLERWREKLRRFDAGEKVCYEYLDGSNNYVELDSVSGREQVIEVIKGFQAEIDTGGKWW